MISTGIVVGLPSEETLAGSYRMGCLDCIRWIASDELYWYRSSWVLSEKLAYYALDGMRKLACY